MYVIVYVLLVYVSRCIKCKAAAMVNYFYVKVTNKNICCRRRKRIPGLVVFVTRYFPTEQDWNNICRSTRNQKIERSNSAAKYVRKVSFEVETFGRTRESTLARPMTVQFVTRNWPALVLSTITVWHTMLINLIHARYY